jgi:hypothetical protein
MSFVKNYQWFIVEVVELGQLVHGKVPFNLLLINNSSRQRLLCDLSIIDFFLHCTFGNESKKTKNTVVYIGSSSCCCDIYL